MKVHTFEDGQVVVLTQDEAMTVNTALNAYLVERKNRLIAALADELYCSEVS